jgi:hypothetical protein
MIYVQASNPMCPPPLRRQTVSILLDRIKITRKRLRVVAAQQNDELRREWQYNLQDLTADQIVCVDESGSDDRTRDRMQGWASKGARAVFRRWLSSRLESQFFLHIQLMDILQTRPLKALVMGKSLRTSCLIIYYLSAIHFQHLVRPLYSITHQSIMPI